MEAHSKTLRLVRSWTRDRCLSKTTSRLSRKSARSITVNWTTRVSRHASIGGTRTLTQRINEPRPQLLTLSRRSIGTSWVRNGPPGTIQWALLDIRQMRPRLSNYSKYRKVWKMRGLLQLRSPKSTPALTLAMPITRAGMAPLRLFIIEIVSVSYKQRK